MVAYNLFGLGVWAPKLFQQQAMGFVEDAESAIPKYHAEIVCDVPIKHLAKPSKPAIKIIKYDTDADKAS